MYLQIESFGYFSVTQADERSEVFQQFPVRSHNPRTPDEPDLASFAPEEPS
jgi:hypothetical protein